MVDILENPPPQLLREHPDLFKAVQFFIDLNEGFAYDPTTKGGLLEMVADFSALGLKIGAVRLGAPVLARIAAALGLRALIPKLADIGDLITGVQDFGDLLNNVPEFFDDMTQAWNEAMELLEGKSRNPEVQSLLTAGTKAAIDTVTFSGQAASFLASPSLIAGGALVLKGFDVVTGWLDFVVAAIPFLPEPRKEPYKALLALPTIEQEVARFERKAEQEREKEPAVVDFSEGKREAQIAARERTFKELLRQEKDFFEFLRATPEFRQPGETLAATLERFLSTPEQVKAESTNARIGAPLQRFSRIPVSDLRALVQQAKQG